jgi:hypothetical protein
MIVEVRDFGANDLLVCFTDSEDVRQQLRKLKCFVSETGYYGSRNDLQAVDIYLDTNQMSASQKRKFKEQMKNHRGRGEE